MSKVQTGQPENASARFIKMRRKHPRLLIDIDNLTITKSIFEKFLFVLCMYNAKKNGNIIAYI